MQDTDITAITEAFALVGAFSEGRTPRYHVTSEAEALKLQETGVANVRKVTGPPNEVGVESGVGSTETLNTAVSGETYAPKLVDAAPDYAGSPGGVLGLPEETQQQPVTTTKSAGTTKSPSTPATASKPRSNS